MFGKKKESRPRRDHTGKNLAQYGLFDMPGSFDEGGLDGELDGNDSDLEAELLALANDSMPSSKPKLPPRKKPSSGRATANLDVMIAESLKDVPSDEDISADEDDPDLLNELQEIAGVHEEPIASPVATAPTSTNDISKLLEERLSMYLLAENNAKAVNDNSRARRFNRGIKTLKDLIKSANAGRSINEEDIPPEVSVNIHKPSPSVPTIQPTEINVIPEEPIPQPEPHEEAKPTPPPRTHSLPSPVVEESRKDEENKEILNLLIARKNEYRIAAVKAKKSGDTATAISYVKIVKQFESVIKAFGDGETVDLSGMPGPPPSSQEIYQPKVEENEKQRGTETPQEESNRTSPGTSEVPMEEGEPESLISADSVAEALQQRLELYKGQEQKAKEEGNSSKARRMGRIVKQFEQAIKLNNAGKPVPFDELPTPPGYAPIPGTVKPPEDVPTPAPSSTPSSPPASAPVSAPSRPAPVKPPVARQDSVSARISGNHMPTTRTEKQVQLLMARQKEFKEAALNAKRKGEIAQAKEYLRTAKQFDPLIEAAQAGLPVDMSTLPINAGAKSKLDETYEFVMGEECLEDDTGTYDALARLEEQLTKQLKMCITTRDHHKALGDVAGTNRFEQLALMVTKDLDVIRIARRTVNVEIPKFHYETKKFNIVKSYTELGDNDLELNIARGINYTCSNPKEIDTYVKYEFPFPQVNIAHEMCEEPLRDRTATVKDTNNPEYNATVIIPIQRSARACLRVFKRHSIKMEVYSKGGLFRGDTLLGTALVKLQPLETECELHDSFDLMDGRKKVGGKLEVRVRVRHPLLTRKVEQLSEKWLIIDH